MKTIINVEIMAIDFPAEVDFHYSEEEGQLVNVYKIDVEPDNCSKGSNLIALYHKCDIFREMINVEITDKYRRGEYED